MSDTPPPPFPTQATPTTEGMATSSLVLGILSCVCLGPLTGIPAILLGHKARAKIATSNGALQGDGLALAGLLLGYLGIAFFMIGFLAALVIPNFVKARSTAQTNACINHLRQIEGAKDQWAIENKRSSGDPVTAADISPFLKGGFEGMQCPAGGHYTINSTGTAPTCNIKGHQLAE